MGDLAETLEALAECEQVLGQLVREVEALPGSIAAVEREAADARATVESEHEGIAELQRRRREQDAELQDCEAQRDRYRAQTANVKTNEEYHALLNEIDQVTRKISDLEEEILVAMDELDQRRERFPALEDEQAEAERGLQERAAGMRERLERAREEIAHREAERDALVGRFPPEFQSHYRRVLQARGNGTTRIRGRTCASCYRDIPYETVNRVFAGELHTCMSCHRILVGTAE